MNKRVAKVYSVALALTVLGIASNLNVCAQLDDKTGVPADISHNFGRLASGAIVKHSFLLKNTADSTLEITAVKTSCRCSVVKEFPKLLMPGSSTELSVEMNTSRKSGPVIEHILVTWSNGRSTTLSLTGYVEGNTLAELDYGKTRKGDRTKRSFSVPTGVAGYSVVRVEADDKYFTTERRETTNGLTMYDVTLNDGIPYGAFNKVITVWTSDTVKPQKSVLVRGEILYPLRVEPNQVLLGQIAPGETKRATVRVFSPYEQSVRVDKVSSKGDRIDWAIQALTDWDLQLNVTLTCSDGDGKVIKSVVEIVATVAGESHTANVEVYGVRKVG